MKRASKYKIPWFKVWGNDLLSSRKFAALNDRLKGALFCCWLMGYSNHSEVGFLPVDIRIIARHFGGNYWAHPARAKRILELLADKRWLDRVTINGVIRYQLHDWERWQASKFDVPEEHSPLSSLEKNSFQSGKPFSSSSPVCLPCGEVDVANKEVTDPPELRVKKKNTLLRNVSVASQSELFLNDNLEDFEAGIFPELIANTLAISKSESYYGMLLDTIENSFALERKIPLKSISDKSDYIALRSMVARVQPAGFTLGVLQAAWSRFLLSSERYHRSQSHPLRWFCNNLGSFLESAVSPINPGQAKRRESAGDRAEREARELFSTPIKPQV